MTRQTSINTYNQIKSEGLLSKKRLLVYEIFMDYGGENGELTGSQVSEIFKKLYPTSQHSETIRNRITELRDMGVLTERGTTDCPISKREVIKFGLTDALPTKLEKKKTQAEKIQDVLMYIEVQGKSQTDEGFKEILRKIYFGVKNLK
jgi:hypothetical protein